MIVAIGAKRVKRPATKRRPTRLTDKSKYFRLAVVNYERANAAKNPKLKAKFMKMAARYRDIALEMDEAESRLGAVIASARAKQK
jgi:hypothetical protein